LLTNTYKKYKIIVVECFW